MSRTEALDAIYELIAKLVPDPIDQLDLRLAAIDVASAAAHESIDLMSQKWQESIHRRYA